MNRTDRPLVGWIQTYTGQAFDLLDPDPLSVDPVDIAHSLSLQCRYNGHTRGFYSVAEHCVHVSRAVPPGLALHGLLHDAAEAYVGDLVRPLKVSVPEFSAAEDRVLAAVFESLSLPGPLMAPEVKDADNRILLDERDALLGPAARAWDQDGLAPLGAPISGWAPVEAEKAWLDRFSELGGWARMISPYQEASSISDVPRQADADPLIRIYGPANCPNCAKAMGVFDRSKIAYEKIVVDEGSPIRGLLTEELGHRAAPIVVVDLVEDGRRRRIQWGGHRIDLITALKAMVGRTRSALAHADR